MPTLPTPTTTGDVWGNQLNNFLKQLQSSADGSINYATTRPTKTASDVGYTMIDTTTREIIRWSGTAWEVLMGGIDKGRPRLSANANIYLNGTNGNDSNDGLTAGTAFQTIDRCVAAVYALDLGNSNITINIAAGFYIGRFDFGIPLLSANGAYITIKGAGSNLVTLQTGANLGPFGIIYNTSNSVIVTGIKMEAIGTTGDYLRGLCQVGFGTITIGPDVNFGNFRVGTNSDHMYTEGGRIYISNNYTVSGGAATHMTAVQAGQYPTYTSGPITSVFSGAGITFDVFAAASFATIYPDMTFTGMATATVKAEANANGLVITKSGWPGTTVNQYTGGIVQ